jgi:hypothetical protein
MDFDDKLLHYLLIFGGMTLASVLHKAADALGWDLVKFLKKQFKRLKKEV